MKTFAAVSALALFGATTLPAQELSRLSNVSVRTSAGGADTLITGFTIGPGSAKQVLVRAVGPTLGAFGVTDALGDPRLVLYDQTGTKLAENDDFNATDSLAFASVGAFQLTPGGKDAALLMTLAPGGYTVEVNGVNGSRGVALVEVYEVTQGAARLVNLSTRARVGTGDGILIPGITVSAGSAPRRLLIRAIGPTLGGFGVPGVLGDPKLDLFSGTTRVAGNDNWEEVTGNSAPTGPQLTALFAQAGAFGLAPGSKDAALLTNLEAGSYTLQVSGVNSATGEALVEVYDLSDNSTTQLRPNSSLYFAQLRPGANAGNSTASGFAAISFQADGTALISVNISNLSSAQSSAYLRLAGTDDYLLSLPLGQVSERAWVINPVGIYSRNDIIRALNEGRLYVSLSTAKFPSGEVEGTLVTSAGSRTFTAPAAPPPLPPQILASPSDIDAARLLTQATFGPTEDSVADVRRLGIEGWIQAQMALPATTLRRSLLDDIARFPTPEKDSLGQPRSAIANLNRNVIWWNMAVEAPDQLRQRTAFALSEIFVVADPNATPHVEEVSLFYDNLIARAFGNYRDVLEDVSLSPVMAWYLTYLHNQKADPVKGTSPDENYARELQQLFTVGLVQLQPDGTLLLDEVGRPIPTYDNTTITETAKVFTGWGYQNERDNFFVYPERNGIKPQLESSFLFRPLKNYPAFHDVTEKKVISLEQKAPGAGAPTVIPAGLSGAAELKILLDTLFRHPNTGPFVVRQLIQRLVTSNPSPGYVHRVARAFADNGRGVRGDLAAVVKAILMDYEARSPEVAGNRGYGKIKEPVIRMAGLWRLMKTRAPSGGFWDSYYFDPKGHDGWHPRCDWMWGMTGTLGQNALESPSVFNFFSPTYTAPGALASAGLVAPELQITDASFAIKVPNYLTRLITKVPRYEPAAPTPSRFLANDFSSLLPLSANPAQLVERLNLLMSGGQMRNTTVSAITRAISDLPAIGGITNYAGVPQMAVGTALVPLRAPAVAAFDPAGPFTIEAWVFPYTGNQGGLIMGKSMTGSPSTLFNLSAAGTRYSVTVTNGTPGSNRSASSSQAITVGTWTHVAGTFDGSTLRIYVNGTLGGQTTGAPTPPAMVTAPFTIGQGLTASGNTVGQGFDGAITQARFWNVVRTPEQIQTSMIEGIPGNRTGLVAGWLLQEGTGATAADYSGNNHPLQANSTQIEWAPTNGTSLERVRTALHLATISTDAAVQK